MFRITKANAMATADDYEFAQPNLLLEEMQLEANEGVVDTNKLLELINLGIRSQADWKAIKSIAQVNFDIAADCSEKDVAKINYYQVSRHRGATLSQSAIDDIQATMSKNSGSSAFKMCGNLLLGTATKEMVQDCKNSGLYKDVLKWPILKLAPPHYLS